jgi:hypothetical protein
MDSSREIYFFAKSSKISNKKETQFGGTESRRFIYLKRKTFKWSFKLGTNVIKLFAVVIYSFL